LKNNNAHIVRKKTVLQGSFLKFIATEYHDASGILREWESFERVNCEGIVVIVPATDEKKLLLIRQFRPPVNSYVIEFPAGLVDAGESFIEAARRELREETGYSATELIFLTRGPMSSGSSGEILTAYLARGLEYEGITDRDEAEHIEMLDIPLVDLVPVLSLLQEQGNLIDLKIYGLTELAKKHLSV
jgi:ADP-ribose pyrophosphatase